MADDKEQRDSAETPDEGQSRRQFIKKLAYIAPVVETFVMVDEAEAQGSSRDSTSRRRNSRLRRNQVSPAPRNRRG